jgi:hypothetical protein
VPHGKDDAHSAFTENPLDTVSAEDDAFEGAFFFWERTRFSKLCSRRGFDSPSAL